MKDKPTFSKDEAKDLISKQIIVKGRKYFLDLKRNKKGSYYYTISETQRNKEGFKRMRIIIHKAYLGQFIELLQDLERDSKKFFN